MAKIRKIKILFLCTGNSCRSQMAEAWTREFHSDTIDAFSAGTRPHRVDPLAIAVMAESGIDMSAQVVKHLSELPKISFDYVFTLCGDARETCPLFPGKTRTIHHGFPDPPRLTDKFTDKEKKLEVYRRVRDQIRAFAASLTNLSNI